MIVSAEDIAAITGKVRIAAQARELEHLGIPFKRRRDGSLLVLRIHVETGQTHPLSEPQRPRPRVRFDA